MSIIQKRLRPLVLACAVAMAAFAVALATGMGVGAQPAHAVEGELAAGAIAGADAVAVEPMDYEYIYEEPSTYKIIAVDDKTAGSAVYNAATKTLTLTNVKAKSLNIHLEKTITVKLVGANSIGSFASCSSLVITGTGSLSVPTYGLYTTNEASSGIAMKGGTIKGKVSSSTGGIKMMGGSIQGAVTVLDGSLKVTGGSIQGAVTVLDGSLKVTGGAIKCSGSDEQIYVSDSMSVSGGTITVKNPKYYGIYVGNGNFKMTGGAITVTNAGSYAISVYKEGSNYKKVSKATIKGGKLKLSVKKPASDFALYAGTVNCKMGCLKSVKGMLSNGAKFKVAGNTYQVREQGYSVRLVSYGAKATKVRINNVTYGKHAYSVTGIGKNAFNTKAGAKVKSIAIKSYVEEIGANAFANTKALTALTFDYTGWLKPVYNSKYTKLLKVKVNTGSTVAKKAFAKCGKNGGKSLKLKLGQYGVFKDYVGKYTTFMRSKGLPKAVKLVTM